MTVADRSVDFGMPARPGSHPRVEVLPREGPGGTGLAGQGREGSDGDEVCVDSEVLFQFLDRQSRSLRDFLRFARRVE